MYGRLVEEPRLHARLDLDDPEQASLVDAMRAWLEARYGGTINNNFVNYYRDGNDSVAWHADRIGLTRSTRSSLSVRWAVPDGSVCGRWAAASPCTSRSGQAICS